MYHKRSNLTTAGGRFLLRSLSNRTERSTLSNALLASGKQLSSTSDVQVCHHNPGVLSGHPKVPRGPWEVLGIPMSTPRSGSPQDIPGTPGGIVGQTGPWDSTKEGSPQDIPGTPHHSRGLGIVLWGIGLVMANLDMSGSRVE